jgi:hypothetical protein
MAMEPITLFAATIDLAGVARKLRELSPTVAIEVQTITGERPWSLSKRRVKSER